MFLVRNAYIFYSPANYISIAYLTYCSAIVFTSLGNFPNLGKFDLFKEDTGS